MKDVIIDTLIDNLKLLPFLFLTYLLMEYIEHKTGEKAEAAIRFSKSPPPNMASSTTTASRPNISARPSSWVWRNISAR